MNITQLGTNSYLSWQHFTLKQIMTLLSLAVLFYLQQNLINFFLLLLYLCYFIVWSASDLMKLLSLFYLLWFCNIDSTRAILLCMSQKSFVQVLILQRYESGKIYKKRYYFYRTSGDTFKKKKRKSHC